MTDLPRPRTVEEHLATILDAVAPLAPVELPLLEALDLVAAVDVASPIDLPRFDNSAMDGYAVRRADVEGASEADPVSLPVAGEIGAGQGSTAITDLPEGQAAKIMTGAPLPAGADCVVPYEWTDRGAEKVRIDQQPGPGQHLRGVGEDVAAGDLLVGAGTMLGPRHLGLLAATGHATVRVRPRPRLVVLSTGSELRQPGDELAPDAIYDGNSYLIAAAATRAGCEPRRLGIVRDDTGSFLAVLERELATADLVVTSGGISMGDYDIVKQALTGAENVWFGPVAMQPGKPQGFGVLPAGDRVVPFFALPGNPVSSYLSFELFVRPAVRQMSGRLPLSRTPLRARLTHDVRSPEGRRQFLRATLSTTPSGQHAAGLEVEPVGGPGSHLLADLATADAVIVVPEEATSVAAGETVTVLRLDGDE